MTITPPTAQITPLNVMVDLSAAYTDSLRTLAQSGQDDTDWTVHAHAAAEQLLTAGAVVLAHAYQRNRPSTDPAAVANDTARRLRRLLSLAEQLAASPPSAESLAMETHAAARACAQLSGELHQAAATLDRAVVTAAYSVRQERNDDRA